MAPYAAPRICARSRYQPTAQRPTTNSDAVNAPPSSEQRQPMRRSGKYMYISAKPSA